MCQGKKNCGERREGERRVIERSCSMCEHPEVREKIVHLRNWKYRHSACPNYSHFWTQNSLKPVSLCILVPSWFSYYQFAKFSSTGMDSGKPFIIASWLPILSFSQRCTLSYSYILFLRSSPHFWPTALIFMVRTK